MFDLQLAQRFMQENSIDAWLVYDFRGSNPIMWEILGGKKWTTRRNFLFIPSNGEPTLLVHKVDYEQFTSFDYTVGLHMSKEEMFDMLEKLLNGCGTVAMEYSPKAEIPAMSWIDGGTLEMVRSFGAEICSSADLFQCAVASWSSEAFNSHVDASRQVNQIKDLAFDFVSEAINKAKVVTEYDIQKFIMNEFSSRGLETQNRPSVCVNENSGKQHYEATKEVSSQIRKGDWLLIDLWARYPGNTGVFCDITWVAYAGREIPSRYQEVFGVVKRARDLVIERLEEAWNEEQVIRGWELDMVARRHIEEAGFGGRFVHRTGHSMGPGPSVHALGVNLDNFETHDTRRVLPGIGFSVEPGIYLPEFGVRLETNVYIDPDRGPVVTAPLQNQIVKLV